MENIILIGHGSPKKDANNLELTADMLHSMLHAGCRNNCVKAAYLQFAEPDIRDTLKKAVRDGARRIIIHPYFLSNGMHVTKDIPGIIDEIKETSPDVEFIYTEPLGINSKLVQIVVERIEAATGLKPWEIEDKSFEVLSGEADFDNIPAERQPVIKRVIHTTADFEYLSSLTFHPDAIKAGVKAIKEGKDILTDVEMVKAGINTKLLQKWGGEVICNIQNTEHRTQSTEQETQFEQFERLKQLERSVPAHRDEQFKTMAEIGIGTALKEDNNIGIVAIGNAPTALLKIIEIFNNSSLLTPHSSLVIGVPVGFVKAVESKALLAAQEFPFITNLSRKGGSTVAVAIVNALLKIAEG